MIRAIFALLALLCACQASYAQYWQGYGGYYRPWPSCGYYGCYAQRPGYGGYPRNKSGDQTYGYPSYGPTRSGFGDYRQYRYVAPHYYYRTRHPRDAGGEFGVGW